MEPSPTDWAYLAGFIDGEGCISTHPGNGRDLKRKRWRPIFSVQQADQVSLLEIYQRFQVGHFTLKKAKSGIQGRWVVNRPNEFQWLIEGVLPYLSLKKRQAEVALGMVGGTTDRAQVRLLSEMKAPRRDVTSH